MARHSGNNALAGGLEDFNGVVMHLLAVQEYMKNNGLDEKIDPMEFVIVLGNNNWTNLTKAPFKQLENYYIKTKEKLVEAMVSEKDTAKLIRVKKHAEAIEALYYLRLESEGHSR